MEKKLDFVILNKIKLTFIIKLLIFANINKVGLLTDIYEIDFLFTINKQLNPYTKQSNKKIIIHNNLSFDELAIYSNFSIIK